MRASGRRSKSSSTPPAGSSGSRRRSAPPGGAAAAQGELRHARRRGHARRAPAGARTQLGGLVASAGHAAAASPRRRPRVRRGVPRRSKPPAGRRRSLPSIDPTWCSIGRSRWRRGVASSNVTWKRGELEKLPIKDGSVDVALLSQALHHAANPARAVAEAARITVPGGRVLILDLREHREEWVRVQARRSHARLQRRRAQAHAGRRRPA